MDAARLELPDDAVDGILCRWGYMLLDEPGAALAEARRVLRPGGRLVFAIWAEADRNPWATTLGRILLERGHIEPPVPGSPGMFALADYDRLAELVRGAGFGDPSFEDVALAAPYGDVDDYLDVQLDLAAQTSVIVRALPAEEYAEVRSELAERLERFRVGERLSLPGVSRIVTAS
jgi:SAM-dependent methyltransferase